MIRADAVHQAGQHYAVGGPAGLASHEYSARGVIQDATAERVLHTNHPLLAVDRVGDPEAAYARSRTRERHAAFLLDRVPHDAGRADVEKALADTSVPLSLAPGRGVMTFGGVSIELGRPPRLRVAPGPPHATPFVEVPFSGEADGRSRTVLGA